jgi:ribosomal RNA-processing protein 1
MRKLWEGIFASMWMCDRALAQQRLANEVAELLFVLPGAEPRDSTGEGGDDDGAVVRLWLVAFWETMAAHWASIDALRMDKFMLLVRRVLAASMRWVAQDGSASSRARADAFGDVLREGPLESEGDIRLGPVGLRLHVLDIWIDEAEKAGLLQGVSSEGSGRGILVEGVVGLLEKVKRCPIKNVRARAAESLDDERLDVSIMESRAGSAPAAEHADAPEAGMARDESDDGSWDGFDD